MSTDQPAVAIVGSGIAGSALAAALATAGVPVLLLERTEEFVDHVRGEYMHPWGVAEAIQLGLHGDLINAGGNVISRFVGYDEVYSQAEVEAGALPLADLVPGVPGALGIGHPTACQALFDAAVQAGAVGLRGVEQVRVTAGESPEVRYVHGGSEHEVRPRLVVAADGRESSTRRQLGIEVEKTDPRIFLAGMLVDGVRDWPSTDSVIGTSGDTILYVIPPGRGQGAALHRLLDRGQDPLGGRRQGEHVARGLPRGHDPRLRSFRRRKPGRAVRCLSNVRFVVRCRRCRWRGICR